MTDGDVDEGRGRLAALFAGELEDRTRRLEDGLLQVEQTTPSARQALLDELVRAAHTLKGSAALLGATQVATISHELEDALEALRTRERVDTETVTRLLADVDRLRRAGNETIRDATSERREPASPHGGVRRLEAAPRAPRSDPGAVRLPARRLDALVDRTATLRVAAGALRSVTERLDDARRGLDVHAGPSADTGEDPRSTVAALGDLERHVRPVLRGLDRAVRGVDVAVRDVVTVPVAEACQGLARHARDITAGQDKEVEVDLDVGGVEVDRTAVTALRDALLHLVRNAVDHGIEPADERRKRGKPATGTVEVSATVAADQVRVVVRDDGRGIDDDAIRAAAGRAGLDPDASAAELLFVPGLTTARRTTEVSGRGVGMDAVRDTMESLGGTVGLTSQPGAGTTVTLTVPASVATARVLLVESDGHQSAILLRGVRRLVRVHTDDLVVADRRSWARIGGDLVMATPLAEVLGMAALDTVAPPARRPAVLVDGPGQDVVLLVDRILGEEEVLVRPMGELVDRLPGVVTAGVLAHGQVVLLLHPAALARLAWERPATERPRTPETEPARRPRVLLAEDAPTTQALERGLLEAAGYEVVTADDGLAAWDLLASQPVDVVVSDVDMPRLDGVALCERIRSSPRLTELPVVLVTSRETEHDRRRGADAGADAYLLKSSFGQGDLVGTIARMLA